MLHRASHVAGDGAAGPLALADARAVEGPNVAAEALGGSVAFAILCTAVLTVTFNGIQPVSGVSLADIPLAITGLCVAGALLGRRRRGIPLTPAWHAVSAYLLLVSGLFATLAVTESTSADIVVTVRFVATLFGVPLIISLVGGTAKRRLILVNFWLASAAINAIVAILDSRGTDIGASLTGISYSYIHREAGLTAHPTHLGFVCVIALPVALARLFTAKRRATRATHLCLAGLLGVALVLTGSRVAAAGGAIVLLCVPAYTRPKSRELAMVFVAAVVLAAGAVFLSSPLPALSALPGRSAASFEGSDVGHLADVQEAQELFWAHPVTGAGYSNIRNAQDIFLQLLEGGGILTLGAFLIFLLGVLRAVVVVRRSAAIDAVEHGLAGAIGTGVVAWIAMGLFQPPIYDRYLYIGPGILMAMLASVTRAQPRPASRRRGHLGQARRHTSLGPTAVVPN